LSEPGSLGSLLLTSCIAGMRSSFMRRGLGSGGIRTRSLTVVGALSIPARRLHHRPALAPAQPLLSADAGGVAALQSRGSDADRDGRDGALARALAAGAELLAPVHRAADRSPGLSRLVRRPRQMWSFPASFMAEFRQPRDVLAAQPAVLADGQRRLARYVEAISVPWRDRVRLRAPVRIEADGCETELRRGGDRDSLRPGAGAARRPEGGRA
jgi:hypothetical protein